MKRKSVRIGWNAIQPQQETPMKNSAAFRLSQRLQDIAHDLQVVINEAAGEPVGFTLLVFTPGRASYISTVAREESVREIKHLLTIWESGVEDTPAHEVN